MTIARDPDLSGDLAIAAGPFNLRPLAPGDALEILDQFADPRVVEFMDIEPLETLEAALDVVAWASQLRAIGAGVRWGIRHRASGAWVGTCGFNRLHLEHGRRGEIAYDLATAWQGWGVMSHVLPGLIGFGFDQLELHRLEAFVTPGNLRSCALLERHGFAREGVLKGYGHWKGRYWDQIVYGRVA